MDLKEWLTYIYVSFLIVFVHIFAYGNNREYTNDRDGTRGTGFYDI